MIAKPGINKRECQEFSYLSKIPAPPQGFLSGHTNTEKKIVAFKKITFIDKKRNSLSMVLIKRKLLASQKDAFQKSFFSLKMSSLS